MGASKELFLRIREEEYLNIPEQIRENVLRDCIYSQSINDFEELIKDEQYKTAWNNYKTAKDKLNDITYYLREKKRNEPKTL